MRSHNKQHTIGGGTLPAVLNILSGEGDLEGGSKARELEELLSNSTFKRLTARWAESTWWPRQDTDKIQRPLRTSSLVERESWTSLELCTSLGTATRGSCTREVTVVVPVRGRGANGCSFLGLGAFFLIMSGTVPVLLVATLVIVAAFVRPEPSVFPVGKSGTRLLRGNPDGMEREARAGKGF